MTHISKSVKETSAIAADICSTLKAGKTATVLALYGDLGSGKTTFVQELAKHLGITDVVQSPTFVIEKIYRISHNNFSNFIHIDAYRIEQEIELVNLGWKELVADPNNLIAIEWADRVEGLLPKDALRIRFKFIDKTTREIRV
ncbi:MAG: tRNA (adenosine(37)-N6)-threonylcarbamoyltransferase complex ATPase subunit type 1 TsaE [Candidatus Taylorbacteria bacterium RIFCSPHIGHO2_02_FULL_46_13]|uniref:tRNA threonylcarbamoyladenosine biosynthesis protein TsaE n=1 Tax=Candidatus Taylorbacteria bacterium RIFCSPHIGHO2_02_FULL_46_13 TaxID=1802312 RepID=A0A1G2MQQ4_9BACT|nr:MAG: tRNA (adenosine(37)-N6)-threonylcarbamoyltransferase complex ATPase subunit type 1 TsaE [Candidatus Taylorbacteria bacterium RIFCSPHIGHO2_02_FULL_46_13]